MTRIVKALPESAASAEPRGPVAREGLRTRVFWSSGITRQAREDTVGTRRWMVASFWLRIAQSWMSY